MKTKLCFFLIAMALPLASTNAQEKLTSAENKFFESKIRPALVKYCYECHSVEAGDSRAGLLVDTRKGLREGGDSGPAVVPHKLDESVFWEAITWEGYEMPPSQKMPDDVIADFKKWIEMGAPDPREQEILNFKSKLTKEDIEQVQKEHWAFQPPRMPATTSPSIDSLVDAKLKEAGLKPAEQAEPFTLLRRINFDLIGLPPTPVEIKAFYAAWKKNPSAAVEQKVDDLLARPQYGERWGRHWLDVARYAESSGSRNFVFPHAWRYRDYVIDSFNDDTPYDQFVSEQVAGDLLPVKSDEQWQENLVATGFLAIGLKHLDQKNPRIFTADMVDEQIDTTTQAVLGLTVACARCHDHKYDPIPTDDYYAMAGIFRSTKTFYGTQRVGQNHRPSGLLLLPVLDKKSLDKGVGQSVSELKSRLAKVEEELSSLGGGRKARNDDELKKKRKSLLNAARRLKGELETLNADGSKKTFGMGVQEADTPVNANILISGEVDRPAQEVSRGFLQVLGDLNFEVKSKESSGREDLVKSMVSKDNPLTARVMANRIWMHLTGRPIVGTPNNFGLSGMKPDNQQLLDYLAVRFMNENWSVKTLIREIVLSKAYQRSATYNEANYIADPDNKFSWRANPRQLDAESMRDSMLAFAGRLDLKRPYGSPVAVGGEGKAGTDQFDISSPIRSVYMPIIRDELSDSLKLFDFPDPNITSASRQESIVPTQALYMMNGDFVTTQAQAMAANLERNFESTKDQVSNAFLWIYGRPATPEELQASAQFFEEFTPSPSAGRSTNAPVQAQSARRGRRGKQDTGNRQQEGRGRRRTRDSTNPSGPAIIKNTTDNQTLSVFCQTLMASARFRILN